MMFYHHWGLRHFRPIWHVPYITLNTTLKLEEGVNKHERLLGEILKPGPEKPYKVKMLEKLGGHYMKIFYSHE